MWFPWSTKSLLVFFLFGIYSQLFGWQIFPCEPLKGFFQCLFVCSKKLAKHILQSWPIHTLSFEWRWSRSFIRLITHSFCSCELLMKEAKKVRSLYIFCEKNIYSIIPRFCIKDRKVTVWKKNKQNKTKTKTEDRFLKALGVVAFGLTVITLIKSLNLINPFKKSLLFSCSFFHVVDRTTWKSTLQDINTTLKEHKTERGRSRVDSCFALLVAHQYSTAQQTEKLC